ncbi:MAG: hypothetical protein ACI9ES_001840, partial [Oceanospirillaceae bacterium]
YSRKTENAVIRSTIRQEKQKQGLWLDGVLSFYSMYFLPKQL